MVMLDELDTFFADGVIDAVLHEVKSGKEATVYCCAGGPAVDAALVAAKVYRPRQRRTFRDDAVYQQGRVIMDRRDRRAFRNKSAHGREVQATLWVGHEFETLRLLHSVGADVPRPLACSSCAIVMDYIGDAYDPASHLLEVDLDRAEAIRLFEVVMRNIELWLACERIHGDLSPYNILYWDGGITIIDVPQAVDPRANPAARDLLARDIENTYRYFERQGVRANPACLADTLWRRFMRGDL